MKVVLKPGDTLEVELHETDGHFEIKYDVDFGKLEVTADMPDTQGREGVIYSEVFLSPQGRMVDALRDGKDPHKETLRLLEAAKNVPKPRTFYKTTFVFEALHEEPIPDDWDLADVLEECETGTYSGDVKSQESVAVGPQTMRKLLIEQRSSPEFLGIENGDEIDFQDVVFERSGVRVTWTWIGEGVDGEFDFDHASEGDEPRLRADVVLLKNGQESDTFSYCTLAPTWTSREGLERMTNELVRRLYVDPSNPKYVIELWTHLTRPQPHEMVQEEGGG